MIFFNFIIPANDRATVPHLWLAWCHAVAESMLSCSGRPTIGWPSGLSLRPVSPKISQSFSRHSEQTNAKIRKQTIMKRIYITIIACLLTSSGFSAAPEARNFGLKVDAEGNATYNHDSVTQIRKLRIDLSLAGKEPASNLVVKWTIYAHTRKDHKQVVIDSGEIKAGLEGGKSVSLTTPQVAIKGVREHSVTSGRGRSRRSKKVPASGNEYYGYAVEVSQGSTLVAEAYSKPSLKNSH